MNEISTTPPDLTPCPVPDWDRIQHDVTKASVFLGHVAATAGDPRNDCARRLLERDEQTGTIRLEDIARLAHRVACQPLDNSLEQVTPYLKEIWSLIFEFSEDSGDHASPLNFADPTPLLDVLEFTHIWQGLATEPITAFSTRQLARLARIDTTIMEQQMNIDRIIYEPYGVSLSEMAGMTAAEQLFWYHQNFVYGLKDAVGWLSKFPGFALPKVIEPFAPSSSHSM